MCNAWNHPPDCTCGWGGYGHKGRRELGDSNPKLNPDFYSAGYASYINPNATCPVCGAQVFFYQSPDGGRVFFDALGPPWPKHPCTDNSSRQVSVGINSNPVAQIGQIAGQREYSWQKEGWKPLICISVSRIRPDFRVCRLDGHFNNSKITLYVPLPSLSSKALYQVRHDKRPDSLQISIMQFTKGTLSQNEEISTFGFLRMPDAYAYLKTLKPAPMVPAGQKNHKPHSAANNHAKGSKQSKRRGEVKDTELKKATSLPTAIELAFALARTNKRIN